MTPLRIGISPCPNDTFAFHAIMERRIDLRGLEFEFELLDVQALNDGLFADRYDLAKASFHAALLLADRYGVLRAGSALGFGVGPLLVAADEGVRPSPQAASSAPGRPPPARSSTAACIPARARSRTPSSPRSGRSSSPAAQTWGS